MTNQQLESVHQNSALHEANEYQMSYDEKALLLKFIWKDKFISADVFKTCVSYYASLAGKYKPRRLLVDARLSKFIMTPEIQQWHDATIVPMYVKAGVTGMAFVIPANIFSEISHKQAFEKQNASRSLPTRFFKDEAEAIVWLIGM